MRTYDGIVRRIERQARILYATCRDVRAVLAASAPLFDRAQRADRHLERLCEVAQRTREVLREAIEWIQARQ